MVWSVFFFFFRAVWCVGVITHGCSQCDFPRLPRTAAAWLLQDPPGDQIRSQVPVFSLQKHPAETFPGPVWAPLLLLLPDQHPQVCMPLSPGWGLGGQVGGMEVRLHTVQQRGCQYKFFMDSGGLAQIKNVKFIGPERWLSS